eukprot:CAMPEP_0204643594 /NCGR_PEP_ID=MMETSP0718-20130828/836_1 /ASSEMBLY_ACC=CAM_ASM_000674 /TAXON_ID=230516 /ORGANISM="Chaetoceros curvisetus" /LENGTH=174 /DNA_ID=CAMNT_0051664875 /DNA_START=51 /DNA_END=575 /DNA_ORIENTATION=-
MSSATITALPRELLQAIPMWLDGRDAYHFQSASRAILQSVNLAVVVNENDGFSWYDCNDARHLWTTIDPAFPLCRTHSILFTCKYKDQGWGNRKGFIHIAESIFEDDEEGETQIKMGNIIYSSPRAEHHWMDLRFEFQPDDGKRYSLWYQVGGGGGHTLHVASVSLKTLIYGSH